MKDHIVFLLPFYLLSFLVLSCVRGTGRERILYINSYHDGYPSSDDIRRGILETLSGSNVALEIFYMDTKRYPGEDHIAGKVREAMQKIHDFKPDVVIASDDNAVQYIVSPYLDTMGIPVVFCGVNWSADRYHLGRNITGMLEVSPLRECIQVLMRQDPEICHIAVLSENTTSERSNTELLDTLYRNLGFEVEYRLVDDFEQWKAAFREISLSAQLIYLPTNGAIRHWNREEAIAFVMENIRVPAITTDDFMMDYAVLGMTKVARQQGEWAASTALDILGGAAPSSIPYTRNSRFRAFLNRKLAGRIGFDLHESPPGGITEIQ